ncbi:hypothetical protein AAG596_05255 [Citromicrobium bathyomarinum]|jgi:hypothetical protein|uniref:hypothetical protein n=1 Tax=Citromicrobium bathyomarinum TaxID=72174 RepID=UPI003159A1B9
MTIRFFAASLAMVATPLALAAAPAAAQGAEAALTIETPIETLMADEAARAVVVAELPDLEASQYYPYIKSMSLKEIQPQSQGAITEEMLARIAAGLAEID